MRVGPMPIHAADKILRTLKKHGLEGDLQSGGEQFTPEEPNTEHPRTESPADLVYVEFDDAALELLRPDLIRLALLDDSVATGDELDGEEWLCPKCGKSFDHSGKCPTHQLELISFDDFAAGKRGAANPVNPVVMILIITAVGGALYYFNR